MPTYLFPNDRNPGFQCGTDSGTIEVTFVGPPSGRQIAENAGDMDGLTFGSTGLVPPSFVSDFLQSSAQAPATNSSSGQNVAPPVEGSHASVQEVLSMLNKWVRAQAEGSLPRPPTDAIEHAQEERANIMWRLRRAIWKQLNHLSHPVSSVAMQPESIKMELRTAWLKECQQWVDYIQ